MNRRNLILLILVIGAISIGNVYLWHPKQIVVISPFGNKDDVIVSILPGNNGLVVAEQRSDRDGVTVWGRGLWAYPFCKQEFISIKVMRDNVILYDNIRTVPVSPTIEIYVNDPSTQVKESSNKP